MSYGTQREAGGQDSLRNLIAHERDWSCPMLTKERGESVPCERHATTVVTYRFEGDWYVTPVCTYHASRAGKGNVVPLADLLSAAEVES